MMKHIETTLDPKYQPFLQADAATGIATCMDDRIYQDGLLQIAGGAYGIGTDLMVSAQVASRGAMPLRDSAAHVYAGLASAALKEQRGITGFLHQGCAAEDGMQIITGEIALAANDKRAAGVLIESAAGLYPLLDERLALRSIAAFARTAQSNAFHAPNIAAAHMEQTAGIARHAVKAGGHVADTIIVGHRANTTFASRAAMDADQPAYHIGLGEWGTILDATERVFPGIELDTVLTVSALRHAATAVHLPGGPLDIQVYA